MKSPVIFPALRRRRISSIPGKTDATPLNPNFPDIFVKALRRNPTEDDDFVYDSSSELNTRRSSRKDLIGGFCSKCKQKLCKDEEYDKEIPLGEVSDSVLAVAHHLRHAKEQRKADAKNEQVKEIMERVATALKHSGLEITGEIAQTMEKFNVTGETTKRKERDDISNAFKRSANLSQIRNNVIEDIDTWLDFLSEDLSSFCEKFPMAEMGSGEEQFRRINKALRKSTDAINKLAKLVKNTSKRVKKVASIKTLVEIDAEVPSDTESKESTESMGQEKIKVIKKVFTDKELSQAKNTRAVVKMIITTLEDGVRSPTISSQLKTNFKTANTQFKIFATVLERNIEKMKELDDKVRQLTSEVTQVKFLEQQKVKDQTKISKLTEDNSSLLENVDELQQTIDDLENQIQMEKLLSKSERKVSITLPSDHSIDDEEVVTEVQQLSPSTMISGQASFATTPRSYTEMNEHQRKSSFSISLHRATPPSKRILPSPKIQKDESFGISIDRDFENNQLEQRIDALNVQLNEAASIINQQQAEMDDMKKRLENQTQKSEVETPEIDITKYEKKVTKVEKQLAKVKKELHSKSEELETEKQKVEDLQKQIEQIMEENVKLQESVVESPKIDIEMKDMPRDQLVSKMKSQFDKELQRLRNYIVKEQQRFQANLRKVQLEHKKYVTSLRNEKTQMMRSLTRFKKVITQFLYQDDEGDEGVEKEAGDEEKLLLYQEGANVSTNAEPLSEMLVALENNLNKALLQKRLMVKHAKASKSTADKTLQQYRERLQQTTDQCNEQEKIANFETKRNKTLTKQFEKLRLNNETLQKEIAPCKELLEKYSSLKRDVERLTSEGRENIEEKKSMIKELEQDRSRLKLELQKLSLSQLTYLETNQRSWQARTCKEKIELVNKAYEENRISTENQQLATQVLSYSSEIVKQEFYNFVKRFMELRKTEVIKETLVRLGKRYKDEVRFSKYLAGVEKRYQIAQNQWLEKKQELSAIKENTYLLLTELLRQQSCHDLEVTSLNIPKQKQVIPKRTSINPNVFPKRAPSKVLDKIVGKRFSNDDHDTSYWQMPPSPQHRVHIRTPKIVELDVNSWKRKLCKEKQVHLPAIATLFSREDI